MWWAFNDDNSTHCTVAQPYASVCVSTEHDTCSNSNLKMASSHAVRLQSLFSFFISSVAFSLHLNVPEVSSTSSMHGISLTSASSLESIFQLNSWQDLRVGNRYSGDCLETSSSSNLSTTGVSMTLFCRAWMHSRDGQPRRTSSSIELNA